MSFARRLVLVGAALMAMVAVSVVIPAGAHITPKVGHAWKHIEPKVQDLLPWAVVDANGSIVSQNGVNSVNHAGTGIYEVIVPRDVSTCSFTASIRDNSNNVALTVHSGNSSMPTVYMYNTLTAASVDHAFTIQGMCSA